MGGSWIGDCGNTAQGKSHTWAEGIQECAGDNSKNSQRGPGGKSKPGQGGRSKPKPEDKPGAGDKQGPGDKSKPGPGRRPKPGRIQPTSGRRPGKNSIRLDQAQGNNLNCRTCGKLASGTSSCCGTGGAWKGICGSQDQVVSGQSTYTWVQGINACQAGSLRGSGGFSQTEISEYDNSAIKAVSAATSCKQISFLAGFVGLVLTYFI